jgi:succinate-semialdehyde dehydrogenase/glutarate-semialdehyde dehydrogenase
MAGNGVVLKHARNVPGCALAIEKVLRQAELPDQLFRSLLVGSRNSAALIQHPIIQGVTFTGSTEAGRKIAALAGESLRKTVLELGGSDPYIVLADADLEMTVASCVTSRLINNGQSCVAAKRFIVHESLHEEFVHIMSQAFASKRLGDPLLETTDIGPLARPDLCEQLDGQVMKSIKQGAKLVVGGKAGASIYQPTVLSDVKPGMAAFDEELFGPVAAVTKAGSDEEAVALANQSEFGLGAALFTSDITRGEHLARTQIKAGACFVNAFVASDPRLPFGGIKSSGYGRELGEIGISEFCNIKTIVVA